jgi:hypothetical protein
MDILIHASEKRSKYHDYLLSKLPTAGAYIDSMNDGNIKSYIDSYLNLINRMKVIAGKRNSNTWHFEDDVLPDRRIYEWMEDLEDKEGIICGFGTTEKFGEVKPEDMWYSFPCIRIPNYYLYGFVWWVLHSGGDEDVVNRLKLGKGIDFLFRKYVIQNPIPIYHHNPCMVEHIDDLIGGSLINTRDKPIKAIRFEDKEALEELKRWLEG